MHRYRSLNILYVGPIRQGNTTLQRLKSFQDLGCQVSVLNTFISKKMFCKPSFLYRVRHRLFGPPDKVGVNGQIKEAIENDEFDFLWIDKGLTIKSSTLGYVKQCQPNCLIVGYSPDDMTGNKRNRSRRFVDNLPFYDLYFTTKTYCVQELQDMGCPRACFIGNAYDENTHHPVTVTGEEKKRLGGTVGFIGQWEPQRAESMYAVAKAGFNVRVWGYTWERCRHQHPNLILENKPLWAEDYAKGICSFDINLCFLRKANRDLQTTRSIEIPACGAFMLAERTDEHLELFEEGKEAEFFSSDEELVEKVRYYSIHDDQRKKNRCRWAAAMHR